MNLTRVERLILVSGMSIAMIVAAYAATSKLSAITASTTALTTGDQLVGVRGGNTDLLFSYAQVGGQTLLADTTYNVATTGNDTTCTLASAAANTTPCASVGKMAALIAANVNVGPCAYHAIIKLADGTYAGNNFLPGYNGCDKGAAWVTNLAPGIEIQGNTSTPANVVIQVDSTVVSGWFGTGDGSTGIGFGAYGGNAVYSIRGMTFTKTGGTGAKFITATRGATLMFDKVVFSANAGGQHVFSAQGANIADYVGGSWTISGGASAALWCGYGGLIQIGGAVTLTGTPGFTGGSAPAFISTQGSGSQVFWSAASVTGSATGFQADIELGGGVSDFASGGIAAIPGNAAAFIDAISKLTNPANGFFYGANPASSYTGAAQTVANLRPATAVTPGFTAFVTDANSTTIGSIVAGGGTNKALLVSDFTNWRIVAAY